MIYLITVNYYSTQLVAKLIDSIQPDEEGNYYIIVINNSPNDNSVKQLDNHRVSVINSEKNLGFGSACNLGISWVYNQDPEAIVWLINPDAYLSPNTLAIAEDFFKKHSGISILGTVIYESSGKVWFGGGEFFPAIGAIRVKGEFTENSDADYWKTDWVSGCSLLINLKNFSESPQFSPDYFLYYEDLDFCRRYACQGHPVAITNQFSVIHRPSSITNRDPYSKILHSTYSYLVMLEQHANWLALILRLARLLLHAMIVIPIHPQVALGKFQGVLTYLKRIIRD